MNQAPDKVESNDRAQIAAALPDNAIAVIGTSAISLAEGPLQVLLSGVLNGMSGARLQSDVCYPDPVDPTINSPAVIAPMEELPDELHLRILEILDRTLASLGDHLGELDSTTLGMTLMIPSSRAGLSIDKEMIGDILWSYLPDLQPHSLEVVSENKSATVALKHLCMKLHSGEIETALFCGVDSTIDAQLYDELAVDGRLLTQSSPQGLIPGEGGAAVLLQSMSRLNPRDREDLSPQAVIGNLAVEPEPHVGAAEEKPMTGLTKAIRSATGQCNDLLTKIPSIFYSMPSRVVFDLEWHQVKKQLWPQRLEESQRVAMMLGEEASPQLDKDARRQEHNLASCLGETGLATLPMLMALACEKIRFDANHKPWGFPADSHHMICELGDQPWRGALWLSAYSDSSTNQ
jgi:hypothetical protein